MNTLSKQMTCSFFASETGYTDLRRHWSLLVRSERRHELAAVHYLFYQVLRGKDWRKSFTFPSNSNKLNNGYQPVLYRALEQLHSTVDEEWVLAPFKDLILPEQLPAVRCLLRHVLVARPLINDDGTYCFDAYVPPEEGGH
jgi:hypothetical protein